MGRPKVLGRVCVACDSTTSYARNGVESWHIHDGNYLCSKCYNRYVMNPIHNPKNSKRWNDIRNPIIHPKRVRFYDKRIILSENPRTGICQNCGKQVGDEYINHDGEIAVVKRTHIHHIEYHEDDPMKDTIELCVACHRRERN